MAIASPGRMGIYLWQVRKKVKKQSEGEKDPRVKPEGDGWGVWGFLDRPQESA